MNEVFIGGETVHHTLQYCVHEFHSECYSATVRGGGTYAS